MKAQLKHFRSKGYHSFAIYMLCNDEVTTEHIGSIDMGFNSIVEDWNAVTLIKVFEIPVIDKRTGENEYILFDIELDIETRRFVATHEALTEEESDSDKIAFCSIDIDPDYSLDRNLEELLTECNTAILESDFFEFSDED